MVAFVSVILGVFSALIIALDLRRHRQSMGIMNPVWVLTGLWAGVLALIAYFWFGREKAGGCSMTPVSGHGTSEPMKDRGMMKMGEGSAMKMRMDNGSRMKMDNSHAVSGMTGMDHSEMKMESMDMSHGDSKMAAAAQVMTMKHRPYWQSITLSTLHCGAGCTLADLIGEWFLYFVVISIGGSLFLGSVVIDYVLALGIGIFFQYAAIRSMSALSPGQAVTKAFKADVLSLTAWQIGMYGFMAFVLFGLYSGTTLPKNSWAFWFMMQIAMLAGFCIAFPVNILLIKWGIKKAM